MRDTVFWCTIENTHTIPTINRMYILRAGMKEKKISRERPILYAFYRVQLHIHSHISVLTHCYIH
jgi:hypothetical protein